MNRITDKKTGMMFAAIYSIVFIVLNVLIFFIFSNKNIVFWTSYAFICIAFIVQILSMVLSFKSLEVQAAFLGIPLASLSFYYFFAAVFTAVVFMFFQQAPFKLAFALQLVILAFFLVVAIITLFSRDAVQDTIDTYDANVMSIRTLQNDVSILQEIVDDAGLKNSLKKLTDTIRYSDPISNESVLDIENEIMQEINGLRTLCENGDTQEAIHSCKQIEILFLQRNNMLKTSK